MLDVDVEGYEVMERLGTGGMAAVYVGYKLGDEGFRRPVVIKRILDAHRSNSDFEEMFIDEANLASRIQHRAVIRVEELRRTPAGLFMVMEYVHGAPLSQLLGELAMRKRQLTVPAAFTIAQEIAAGLHAAHEVRGDDDKRLNLVHRDMSPQNVLLGVNGAVKVIDFGIAKARTRLHQTMGTGAKGKLRYMAPEQLSGGTIDRRADIFALGVVLWEMLTNQRLFGDKSETKVVDRILTGDVPPPSQIVASIPPEVDPLVLRTLSVDPNDRPQTARELRRELDAISRVVDEERIAALVTMLFGAELEDRARRLPGVPATSLNTLELPVAPLAAYEELTIDVTKSDRPSWHEPPPASTSRDGIFDVTRAGEAVAIRWASDAAQPWKPVALYFALIMMIEMFPMKWWARVAAQMVCVAAGVIAVWRVLRRRIDDELRIEDGVVRVRVGNDEDVVPAKDVTGVEAGDGFVRVHTMTGTMDVKVPKQEAERLAKLTQTAITAAQTEVD